MVGGLQDILVVHIAHDSCFCPESRLPERLLRRTRVDRSYLPYGEHQKANRTNPLLAIILNLRGRCASASRARQVGLASARSSCTRSRSADQLSPARDVRQPKTKSGRQSPLRAPGIRCWTRDDPTRVGGTSVGYLSVRRGAQDARQGWRLGQARCWE